ncbi:MAG: methyl-accepting chemotaxis protein [Spirochaetia bacterium]|nr:methyl-accepting chemotaxis protein [Spirochaetia bacterium]
MKKKDDSGNTDKIDDVSILVEDDTFIRKYSIQQQITGGITFILGGIATIAAIVVFVMGRLYVINDAKEHYEEIAHSSAVMVQQSLLKHAQFLEQFSENEVLHRSLSRNDPNLLKEPINHYISRNIEMEGIWILTGDGKVFAYNQRNNTNETRWGDLVRKNYSSEDWFYKCKNTKVPLFYPDALNLKTDETSLPKNVYLWTQPISDGKGCVVVFENSTLLSKNIFKKITFNRKNLKLRTIQAHVLGMDGQVLYSTDSDWNKYIANKEKYNPMTLYIKSDAIGSRIEQIHNRNVMFAWSTLKENLGAQEDLFLNAAVVIQVDTNEVFKPLYYLILLLIGLVLFVTSTASYLSYSRSKKLVHFPIMEMEENMEKAISGDLSFESIKIIDKNDIGFLAYNINQMVNRFRGMLALMLDSGKEVMDEGKKLFNNLGIMQETALKSKNMLKDASAIVTQIARVSEEVYQDVITSQNIASTNRAAMENLRVSFEESGNKRLEITVSAKNVVQKSNSGLQTIDEFAKNVEKISESSKKIRGIINIIDNISDQTNLLALNASIEAARAGVHGQGFSVVANEISELAKRSATSAQEITSLIKETVQQVVDVSTKVESAKGFFKQIVEMMKKLDKEIIDMADAVTLQEISVSETAERAQKNAMISKKISEITKNQTLHTESLDLIMKKIEVLSIESNKEIEEDDQLLQIFMSKIKKLVDVASQFKIHKETLESKINTLKKDA